MANNRIQVKRTSTAGRTANVTNSGNSQYIAAGEFALNMADGILYTSNGSSLIEVGANNTNVRVTSALTLDNDRNLYFKTVNTSATVGFRQQNDDNFVFYSTNTTYGSRPVFAIYANSDTSAFSILTPITFNGNVTQLPANGTTGSAGQVLAANGTGGIYWSSAGGGGSGTVTSVASGNGLTGGPITSSGTLSVLANTGIVANATGVFVNATYINTISSNSSTYANASITNTFTVGTASYFVANGNFGISNTAPTHKFRVDGDISLSAGIHANGSFGTSGQVLTTNGTVAYWSTVSGGSGSTVVRQQYTGNGTNTVFTVSGGYTPDNLDVYVNGVKLYSGTEVTVTSGSTFTLAQPAPSGMLIEVVGSSNATPIASSTTNTFTIGTASYFVSNGNFGVGNDSPSDLLSVDGTTYLGGNTTVFGINANGSLGTAGQTLTSNGTVTYWSTSGFSNGQSISVNDFVVTGSFTANGTTGTAGQTLTSNGTATYWSTASGGGFTNGESISVNNFVITGAFTANSANGTSGQILTSNGTATYWSSTANNANNLGGVVATSYATLTGAQTLSSKRITPRVSTSTTLSTLTVDISSFDVYVITAQNQNLSLAASTTGTPVNGDKITIRIKDNGAGQSILWSTGVSGGWRAVGTSLPSSTVATKTLYIGAIYNSTDSRWDVIATAQEV